jgi:hypothetical protein
MAVRIQSALALHPTGHTRELMARVTIWMCWLSVGIGGCSILDSAPALRSPSSPSSRWVAGNGGLLPDEDPCARIAGEAARPLMDLCSGRRIHVRVLCNDEAKAYAWTDGEIYITRGLVQHLSADELSAVVAHELGHLLDDGTLQTVFALDGRTADDDAEARADELGIQLLLTANLPGSAMREMLQKLKDFTTTSRDERDRIAYRIDRLQHAH